MRTLDSIELSLSTMLDAMRKDNSCMGMSESRKSSLSIRFGAMRLQEGVEEPCHKLGKAVSEDGNSNKD